MLFAPAKPLLRRFLDHDVLSGAVIVGVVTLGVKGVAFLKELVVAHRFGTSDEVDAYVVAMLIPSIVALSVGNAFRDAFVPVYAEERLKKPMEAERLVSDTVRICFVLLLVLTAGAVIFSESIIDWVATGFSPEKTALCVKFFRMVSLYTICVGVGIVLRGYLQTHRRFFVSAAASALIPGTIIAVLLAPGQASGTRLALATSLGAAALFIVLLSACYRLHRGLRCGRLRRERPASTVGRVLLPQIPPLFAGALVMESYLFVDTLMVSVLPPGSVAVLTYGERVCGVVCLVGAAIAQALFPHISGLAAKRDWASFRATTGRLGTLIVVLSAPIVAIFWFAAEPLVRIVFQRGEFSPEDTRQVAEVLRFAGFQVPGSILLALNARAVMALRDGGFIVVSAGLGLGLNVGLNLLFIDWYGVKGVALSTALVSLFSAALLFGRAEILLRRLNRDTEN
ncbi:MAG: lipid II flippase MurJ [Verrucomicrobiales bacterium]